MTVSRSLRRLLGVLELEEQQARTALEMAAGELRTLEARLAFMLERERGGRRLVGMSAASGNLSDRLAGLEDARFARSAAAFLKVRAAAAERQATERRSEFMAKRIERRQAETLVRESKARERVEAERIAQRSLDDWFLNRTGNAGKQTDPSAKTPATKSTGIEPS